MSSRPVYSSRHHAYSCRCPQCSKPGDWGLIGPLLLFGGIITVVGFWPAMVWHGTTDTGGWRWDIHSTVAELVYWGVLIVAGVLVAADSGRLKLPGPRPATGVPLLPPLPSVCVPAPPACYHLHAVKVESIIDPDKAVAWWCPDAPEGCGTQLDEDFGRLMRPCCGTPPGTPHWWNCAHYSERT